MKKTLIAICLIISAVSSALALPLGTPIASDEFPEVVYLRITHNRSIGGTESYACTGTIISPRHILTAKHCFDGPNEPEENEVFSTRVINGQSPFSLINVQYQDSYTGNIIDASSWHLLPGGSKYEHDVAIIEIPVTNTPPAKILREDLWQFWEDLISERGDISGSNAIDTEVTQIGFGGNPNNKRLMHAEMTLEPGSPVTYQYNHNYFNWQYPSEWRDDYFTASVPRETTEGGDSGGPIFIGHLSNSDARYSLGVLFGKPGGEASGVPFDAGYIDYSSEYNLVHKEHVMEFFAGIPNFSLLCGSRGINCESRFTELYRAFWGSDPEEDWSYWSPIVDKLETGELTIHQLERAYAARTFQDPNTGSFTKNPTDAEIDNLINRVYAENISISQIRSEMAGGTLTSGSPPSEQNKLTLAMLVSILF